MAKTLSQLTIVLFTIFFSSAMVSTSQSDESYYKTISPSKLGLKKQKLVYLHFYAHEIVTGPNQTAVIVAEGPNTSQSPTFFGRVSVHDFPLVETPEANSKEIGRAQGLLAWASQSEISTLKPFTLLFTDRQFNGSTLSVLGRNPISQSVRELPIVGGTGLFRFSTGYLLSSTYSINSTDRYIEYKAYVYHY